MAGGMGARGEFWQIAGRQVAQFDSGLSQVNGLLLLTPDQWEVTRTFSFPVSLHCQVKKHIYYAGLSSIPESRGHI